MNTLIQCSITGCATEIIVSEPVGAKARFICKNHTRDEQLKAVGRKFNPMKDEQDKEERFQEHQFDKKMGRARKPQGTNHIQNQGDNTLDAELCIKALENAGIVPGKK